MFAQHTTTNNHYNCILKAKLRTSFSKYHLVIKNEESKDSKKKSDSSQSKKNRGV